MSDQKVVRVLFVCMGNICRSPTAHGVFRSMVEKAGLGAMIEVDSAGTHAYHVGESPDPRAQQTARRRGVDLSDLRARQASPVDMECFDYVLAMDEENFQGLHSICPRGVEHKIQLFMDFAPELRVRSVPDPYYGGPRGFEQVFDMVESAALGLLNHIRADRTDESLSKR